MNNKKNNSYNYIINYIKNNKDLLDKDELKFLLLYAAELKLRGIKNLNKVNLKLLIKDLTFLNKKIQSGKLTSISFKRLERELQLFEDILNNVDLDKVSYELDKLYIENDLGIRENSTLVKNLHNNYDKKVSK